jgi:hypothetical protein
MFQNVVNRDPAPAVEGDFASANPRHVLLAGPGALTAAAAGLTIGRFGFARNDTGVTGNVDPGVPFRVGFVHRNQPTLITAWLGAGSMLVTSGLEVTLFDLGDFWVRFAAGAAIGLKVFASLADGTARAAAAGTVIAGFLETHWTVHSTAAAGEIAKISSVGI